MKRATVLVLGAILAASAGAGFLLSRPKNPPVQPAAVQRPLASRWESVARFGPRPPGSAGLEGAREYIAGEFEGLGYRTDRVPVEYEVARSLEGAVQVGRDRLPAMTAPGAGSGEQEGPLVVLPAGSKLDGLGESAVQARIVLAPCVWRGTREFVSELLRSGAFGVVLYGCGERLPEKVEATPLPVVLVDQSAGVTLRSRAGSIVKVEANAVTSTVRGEVLTASRVGSAPRVVIGGRLDGAENSLSANLGASGALAVLEAARRLSGDPLAEQVWFVVFEGTGSNFAGSRAFVEENRYALRQTRAMIDLESVGLDTATLGVAGDLELVRVAHDALPGVRVFREPEPRRESFGREEFHGEGNHAPFVAWGVRTLILRRVGPVPERTRRDEHLNVALVAQTARAATILAREALARPWTPSAICDGFDRSGCSE